MRNVVSSRPLERTRPRLASSRDTDSASDSARHAAVGAASAVDELEAEIAQLLGVHPAQQDVTNHWVSGALGPARLQLQAYGRLTGTEVIQIAMGVGLRHAFMLPIANRDPVVSLRARRVGRQLPRIDP
jgi:hypothetical protein